MANIFNSVKVRAPKYNVFNLSHSTKFSCNFSKLIPFICQEVYPGETWTVSTQGFVRFLPLVTPMMHHIDVKMWYFFVPNRLVNEHWRDFITYGVNGPDASLAPKYAKPYVDVTNNAIVGTGGKLSYADFSDGSLMDFLGFPTPSMDEWKQSTGGDGFNGIDLMPFVGYHLIYNEYFINRNVQSNFDSQLSKAVKFVGKQPITGNEWLFKLHSVNWSMDYYTSCLPFVQRGVAAPIPVQGEIELLNQDYNGAATKAKPSQADAPTQPYDSDLKTDESSDVQGDRIDGSGAQNIQLDITGHTEARFVGSTATINDLRWATRLQQWMEKSARVGSRYIEQIKAHFGVTSSDARQQRPELLGAGSFPVVISDIEQTSDTQQQTTPQGNLAGKGTGFGVTKGWKKNFEEHGFLFGIMCVSPRAMYKNIWPRQFLRYNPMDYYFPEFQHLGEQAITKREVSPSFKTSDAAYNSALFGYQQRFAEMRYIPSTIHGNFKNDPALSRWVMVRDLGKVALNSDFVTQQCDYNNFADETDGSDHILIELWNDVKASRPLDVYATPTL